MKAKAYNAITLDTSVFENHGLKLDKGLLGSMSQFKAAPTVFVLTDIVVKELTKHLEEKIKKSRVSLERAIEGIREHNLLDINELDGFKKKLNDANDCVEIAQSKVHEFVEVTGAVVIDSHNYVSVKVLVDKYFSNEPPFAAAGEKQKEFPDAISLISLNNWAKENKKIIYAVSKDNDWKSYCKPEELIDYYEDLSQALDDFNRAHVPFTLVSKLEKNIGDGTCQSFISQLNSQLSTAFYYVDLVPEADSAFYWESDGWSVDYVELNSVHEELGIIRTEDSYIVVEATVNVTLSVDGSFSLSIFDSIDRDYVSMGSVHRNIQDSFDLQVLITLTGDFEEAEDDIDALEIEDIELISDLGSVYFGELEMDYEPDYEPEDGE